MTSYELFLLLMCLALFIALCFVYARFRLYNRMYNESLLIIRNYEDLVDMYNNKRITKALSAKGEK